MGITLAHNATVYLEQVVSRTADLMVPSTTGELQKHIQEEVDHLWARLRSAVLMDAHSLASARETP